MKIEEKINHQLVFGNYFFASIIEAEITKSFLKDNQVNFRQEDYPFEATINIINCNQDNCFRVPSEY
jgi:hypothetical protein